MLSPCVQEKAVGRNRASYTLENRRMQIANRYSLEISLKTAENGRFFAHS